MSSLFDYFIAGIPILAQPKMTGARFGITDSREVWISVAMHAVTFGDRDKAAGKRMAKQIDVVQVASLKHEWREASGVLTYGR